MRENIYVRMRRCEGALIRTLGLIERRGFSVVSIDTLPAGPASDLRVQIQVESEARCFETLTGQLNRLLDVRSARLKDYQEAQYRARTSTQ